MNKSRFVLHNLDKPEDRPPRLSSVKWEVEKPEKKPRNFKRSKYEQFYSVSPRTFDNLIEDIDL